MNYSRIVSFLKTADNGGMKTQNTHIAINEIGSQALNVNTAEAFDLSVLDALKPYEIKTMLLPVIHRKEFVDLPQMKQTVKEYLSDLLTLTAEEQAFLSDFVNKRYSPEKLFPDPDIRARIQNHPMVEWKMSQ